MGGLSGSLQNKALALEATVDGKLGPELGVHVLTLL